MPLDQKGNPVKAEIRGAVFPARLKSYTEKHNQMQVERWFHLVDTETRAGAIQRESYGYQTFLANRVGEIQKSTSVEDWTWIPGELNIADFLTRGTAQENPKVASVWQNGLEFRERLVEEWPSRTAKVVDADAKT